MASPVCMACGLAAPAQSTVQAAQALLHCRSACLDTVQVGDVAAEGSVRADHRPGGRSGML